MLPFFACETFEAFGEVETNDRRSKDVSWQLWLNTSCISAALLKVFASRWTNDGCLALKKRLNLKGRMKGVANILGQVVR